MNQNIFNFLISMLTKLFVRVLALSTSSYFLLSNLNFVNNKYHLELVDFKNSLNLLHNSL